MQKKYTPDFLYDLATLLRGKKEFGKAIYIYTILINNYDYSIYSTKAGYDLEKVMAEPYTISSEMFNPDQYKISYSFNITDNELFELVLTNMFVFIWLGPLFGGHVVSIWLLALSPVSLIFVYMVGIIPAAFASIIFSAYIYFQTKRNKQLPRFVDLFLASSLSGTLAIVLLSPFIAETSSDFYQSFVILSGSGFLGGVVSGLVSGLIMRSRIKPNKTLNFTACSN
jgi:hypothetical protein